MIINNYEDYKRARSKCSQLFNQIIALQYSKKLPKLKEEYIKLCDTIDEYQKKHPEDQKRYNSSLFTI